MSHLSIYRIHRILINIKTISILDVETIKLQFLQQHVQAPKFQTFRIVLHILPDIRHGVNLSWTYVSLPCWKIESGGNLILGAVYFEGFWVYFWVLVSQVAGEEAVLASDYINWAGSNWRIPNTFQCDRRFIYSSNHHVFC